MGYSDLSTATALIALMVLSFGKHSLGISATGLKSLSINLSPVLRINGGRLSGLVMMLPHGFEGQGPEHSSARLERFLTLAAEDNMLIVNTTTPAQHYHCLRRHTKRRWKKPLIMMTPKSLLRNKHAVSSLEELANGSFEELIDDPSIVDHSSIKLILLCSGKVYYDLLEKRAELERNDVAILRLEQLYPLPFEVMGKIIERYNSEVPIRWVQEEPKNMGASRYIRSQIGEHKYIDHPLEFVHRMESASPATGSPNAHRLEQATFTE